ncbi:MAG: hypothetical protein UY21_C0001G0042 [Microgenomates group bacterium GW2011_GWA1_48_10]|nr:MAG: hypothetical protein UY21_C0001G0042 [Microgenomates group bacterium GW2011_GWA1_48_10]
MRKFLKTNSFVITVFVIWRLAMFLLGLPGFSILTFKASFPKIDEMLIASGFPQWLWQWGNFDGVHYLDIAQNGYHGSGLQVFFPVFPLLIKLGSFLTGNYFLSGLVISNLAILLAGITLFQLVSRDFDNKTARWAVIFLFAFPTSFFFGSVYTESLFLLFLLLTFLKTGWLSGLFSFLAGGTRLVGAFLTPVLVAFRPRNWWGILAGGGIGLYISYLTLTFGNPFYFLTGQGAFKNARANSLESLVLPPQVLYRYIKILTTASPAHYDYWIAALELAAFIFGLIIVLYLTLRKKMPAPYLIFSFLALLLPSFSGTLSSMPRYLLSIFPIFIGLAIIKNNSVKVGIVTLFTLLLAALTILFTRGYWVS